MNYQNFNSQEEIDAGMDRIVVPSVPDVEATSRNLQRKTVGTMKLALAGFTAFLGYADKSNHEAVGADPFAVAVAAAATSDTEGVSIVKPLTQEEINLKIDEKRVAYRAQFRADLTKIDASTGQAKYMNARMLVVNLQKESEKAKDDFAIVAINELLLEVATIAGRYDVALQANAVLTPDIELYTSMFFEKEKKMLEEARKHPLNAKMLPTLSDIAKETKERDAALEALNALVQNPKDPERNQQIGSYIFYNRGFEKGFEEASVKGLNYLKEGNSPLDRLLAAEGGDGIALWGLSIKEPDLTKRKRIQMRSLAVYKADPSKYTSEQRVIFEDLIKKNPALASTGTARVTISLVAAPDIKPVESSSTPAKSADVNKGTWVNAMQYVDQKTLNSKGGTVVANGQGGLAFLGKSKGSASLAFPFKANGEYDLVAKFVEGDGAKNLGITFPVGQKQCTLLKGPDFIGFDTIGGKRAGANESMQKFKAEALEVTVKLSVSKKPGSETDVILVADIERQDGEKKVVRYEGPMDALATHDAWGAEANKFAFANRLTDVNLIQFMILNKSGSFVLDNTTASR